MTLLKVIGTEVNAATLGPQSFTGNTANVTGNHIPFASGQRFVNGQIVTYSVATGNTPLTGLTNGASYYTVFANTTNLCLANTLGGANLAISTACASVSETGHSLFAANSLGNIQNIRVINLVAASLLHISSNAVPAVELATITVTNSEVLYLQKNATDTVWCNGTLAISVAPIALKG